MAEIWQAPDSYQPADEVEAAMMNKLAEYRGVIEAKKVELARVARVHDELAARYAALDSASQALERALSLCRDDTVRDGSPAGNPYAVGPHHGRHLMAAHDALRRALRREP